MNRKTNSGFIIPVVILFSLIILGIIAYFFSPKSINSIKTAIPSASPVVSVVSTKPITIDTNSDLKKEYKTSLYTIEYPQDLFLKECGSGICINLPSYKDIYIVCPRSSMNETNLPNPKDWEGNEGDFTVKYLKKISLNGLVGQQYIWTAPDNSGSIYTDLLRNTEPLVCTLSLRGISVKSGYEEFINSQMVYNKILSTFKFTN